MTYEPLSYWRRRGQTFATQELAFVDLLSGLSFASVLDVGCGPGRLGALVKGLRPDVSYTGIDISPDVLRLAAVRVPDGSFHETTLADFRPRRTWDLVIASEILMHVPPPEVGDAIERLSALSNRHVVTIDWTTDGPAASHNFRHDYRTAFASSGLSVIADRQVGEQTIYGLVA